MDIQVVSSSVYSNSATDVPAATPNITNRTIHGFIRLIMGYATSATTNLLGSIMGTSSVLWFIMRNDEAVKPGFAWM